MTTAEEPKLSLNEKLNRARLRHQRSIMTFYFSSMIWWTCNLLGLVFIWRKVSPPPSEQKRKQLHPPSTFFLWFLSVYVALFTITSGRYQKYVSQIENRANAVIVLLTSTPKPLKDFFPLIADAQNMLCPLEPGILEPHTIIGSLLLPFDNHKGLPNYPYKEGRILLSKVVSAYRTALENVDLSGAYLADTDLTNANLTNANLTNANLTNANLASAFAHKPQQPNELAKVLHPCSTLYKAKLDPEVEAILRKAKPSLFDKPDGYDE